MTRLRYLLWLVLPGLLVLALMLTNDHVTDLYHLQRVQPFALVALAKALMIAVLLVQHPGPPPNVHRFHVWRWLDPVVIVLIGTTVPSIIYFVMLFGGNSQWFRAPDWGYNVARQLMWVFGYIAIIVWCELAWQGVQARRERRLTVQMRHVDGEEA